MRTKPTKPLPTKKEQTEAEDNTDIFLIFAVMIALTIGATLYFGALTPPLAKEELQSIRADLLRLSMPDSLFGSDRE